VLITGASSGIGRELAKVFAARGFQPILVARDESRLSSLAEDLRSRHGVQPKIIVADLARPSSAAEIFTQLQTEQIEVAILVNNAGFGLTGPFAAGPLATYCDMVQVNVTSLLQLTGLFVPAMVARGEGKILNVASTAAFEPGPLMAVYYASKAFVFSYSYALADELARSGVSVTTLCPGPTRTAFHARAGTSRSERLIGKWMMSAEEVAEEGFRALMARKRVIIPGFINKLGFLLAKCAPTWLAAKVARKVVEG